MATAAATVAKSVPMSPKFRASAYLHLALGLATFKVGIAPFHSEPKEGLSHYICEDHLAKVKQRWYCEAGDHFIERDDGQGGVTYQPVKGYPFGDQYVTLDREELDKIVIPKQDSLAFDRWDDHLDPVWVEKTYLMQAADDAGQRTYDAFAAALREYGIVLFGTVCLHKTTHLMALKWSDDLGTLVLHQLHLAARLKLHAAEGSAVGIAVRPDPPKKVVAEVKRTVNAVTVKGQEHDTPDYAREALVAAIEKVATGGMLDDKKETVEPKAVDLMAALRASVEAAQEAKKPKKSPVKTRARKGGTR